MTYAINLQALPLGITPRLDSSVQSRIVISTPEGLVQLLVLGRYWSLGFGLRHQIAHLIKGFLL